MSVPRPSAFKSFRGISQFLLANAQIVTWATATSFPIVSTLMFKQQSYHLILHNVSGCANVAK
jgi:hypothetical protein